MRQKSFFSNEKSPLAPLVKGIQEVPLKKLTRVGFLELLPQMEFAKWTIGCFFEFWTHLHSRRAKNLPLRALKKGDLGRFALQNSALFDFAIIRQRFIWIVVTIIIAITMGACAPACNDNLTETAFRATVLSTDSNKLVVLTEGEHLQIAITSTTRVSEEFASLVNKDVWVSGIILDKHQIQAHEIRLLNALN